MDGSCPTSVVVVSDGGTWAGGGDDGWTSH